MSTRSYTWRGFSATIEVPDSVGRLIRRTSRLGGGTAASGRLIFADPLPQLLIQSRNFEDALQYFRAWFSPVHSGSTARGGKQLGEGPVIGGSDMDEAVDAFPWYHSIELPGGVVTPGIFDHRPLVPHYGLPADLSTQRALDVATFDGFWAFELERRGAEVVAVDIDRLSSLDLPPQLRSAIVADGLDRESGQGFSLAHRALNSKVQRVVSSVYDLDPAALGTFDLVHVADLLLHLERPLDALRHIRSVTRGTALIADVIDLHLKRSDNQLVQYLGGWWSAMWWIPSLDALAQMVLDAGFSRVRLHTVYNLAGVHEHDGLWRAVLIADA